MVTVSPKDFSDFEYSKIFAFVTLDAYDYSDLFFEKNMDISKFGDTISHQLDSSQTVYLNDLLSGRYRKPYPKADSVRAVADCFFPRHNIIFVDQNDSIVQFVSVCFECGNAKSSKEYLADMGNLKSFFNSIGLKVFDRPDLHSAHYDSLRQASIK